MVLELRLQHYLILCASIGNHKISKLIYLFIFTHTRVKNFENKHFIMTNLPNSHAIENRQYNSMEEKSNTRKDIKTPGGQTK